MVSRSVGRYDWNIRERRDKSQTKRPVALNVYKIMQADLTLIRIWQSTELDAQKSAHSVRWYVRWSCWRSSPPRWRRSWSSCHRGQPSAAERRGVARWRNGACAAPAVLCPPSRRRSRCRRTAVAARRQTRWWRRAQPSGASCRAPDSHRRRHNASASVGSRRKRRRVVARFRRSWSPSRRRRSARGRSQLSNDRDKDTFVLPCAINKSINQSNLLNRRH